MLLKPKDDSVLLRDPRSNVALPSYGGSVPNTNFWVRRQLDGDALVTTQSDIDAGRAKAKSDANDKAKSEESAKPEKAAKTNKTATSAKPE